MTFESLTIYVDFDDRDVDTVVVANTTQMCAELLQR